MAENIYNKTISNGMGAAGPAFNPDGTFQASSRGTLIGNWYEERALRTFTGVGRSIVKEHIPKKHLNFEEPIRHTKKFDNTHDRIYGDRKDEPMYSENFHYGKGVNPADALPKVGLKNRRLEQEMMELIAAELKEKEDEKERLRQVRFFDTTAKTDFKTKLLTENTIGRWVMRT